MRAEIAEIGGFASINPEGTLMLFSALAELIHRRGGTFAVATAASVLRRRLGWLNVPTMELARASLDRAGADALGWGQYYTRDPRVVAGKISDAILALRAAMPPDARSLRRLQNPVQTYAFSDMAG